MSVRVMTMIWRFEAPYDEKIVLLKLADCANDDGASIYPSVKRIAADCGMSERKVRAVLAKYRQAGVLLVDKAANPGTKMPTVYRLDLKTIETGTKESTTPAQRAPLHNVHPCTPCTLTPAQRAPLPLHSVQGEPSLEPSSEPSLETIAHPPLKPRRTMARDVKTQAAEFEAWWSQAPRKVGKGQARKAYARARLKASADDLLAGVMRHAAAMAGRDPEYIPHPTTWLNGERWLDEETRHDQQHRAQQRPAARPRNGTEAALAGIFGLGAEGGEPGGLDDAEPRMVRAASFGHSRRAG